MGQRWDGEQVLALAPDEASVRAARGLSTDSPWSAAGAADTQTFTAMWGLCAGSGKRPYQVIVDLTGPAYKCTCPSRKFPCKHALALLLRWSSGQVADTEIPPWAGEWLEDRAAKSLTVRAERTPDPVAAAKRAEQREARVSAGLDELDQWLSDQVRTGLAGLSRGGYAQLDAMAARMVDAQAPAVAGTLRRLSTVGTGWTDTVLAEYGMLRLLVRAHRRISELPAPLAATVKAQVGYPVSREDVLATAPVTDTWQVLGWRDTEDPRLRTRRAWLLGKQTGRPALVLSYAASVQQSLDASLIPGEEVRADAHFYPGAEGLRVLIGERHGEPQRISEIAAMPPGPAPPGTMAQAASQWAAGLAANPWLEAWPVLLAGVTPVRHDDDWTLVGDGTVRLLGADPWPLVAVSGGHPVDVLAEWTATGVRAVSVLTETAVIRL
ncbi:SWIM zinc finger family protein [Fodinicola feengrottensis]|uniref:SWIM zinc finger family protein n=1 Tax=Fodinicola feengrottensis TaxID=435914 RepID=UPI0031E19DDF